MHTPINQWPTAPPTTPPLTYITTAIAHYYQTDYNQITSRTRKQKPTHARQTAMWMIRKLSNNQVPLTEIGEFFNRDHTSVIHATKKIQKQADTNPETKRQLQQLEQLIRDNAHHNILTKNP